MPDSVAPGKSRPAGQSRVRYPGKRLEELLEEEDDEEELPTEAEDLLEEEEELLDDETLGEDEDEVLGEEDELLEGAGQLEELLEGEGELLEDEELLLEDGDGEEEDEDEELLEDGDGEDEDDELLLEEDEELLEEEDEEELPHEENDPPEGELLLEEEDDELLEEGEELLEEELPHEENDPPDGELLLEEEDDGLLEEDEELLEDEDDEPFGGGGKALAAATPTGLPLEPAVCWFVGPLSQFFNHSSMNLVSSRVGARAASQIDRSAVEISGERVTPMRLGESFERVLARDGNGFDQGGKLLLRGGAEAEAHPERTGQILQAEDKIHFRAEHAFFAGGGLLAEGHEAVVQGDPKRDFAFFLQEKKFLQGRDNLAARRRTAIFPTGEKTIAQIFRDAAPAFLDDAMAVAEPAAYAEGEAVDFPFAAHDGKLFDIGDKQPEVLLAQVEDRGIAGGAILRGKNGGFVRAPPGERWLTKGEGGPADGEAIAIAEPRRPDDALVIAVGPVSADQIDEPEFDFVLDVDDGVIAGSLGGIDHDLALWPAAKGAFTMDGPPATVGGFQPGAVGVSIRWIGSKGHREGGWVYLASCKHPILRLKRAVDQAGSEREDADRGPRAAY
jgi:hypothetical protein